MQRKLFIVYLLLPAIGIVAFLSGCSEKNGVTETDNLPAQSSIITDYISVWRSVPNLFPMNKIYPEPKNIRDARCDKIVEEVIADRARNERIELNIERKGILEKFETAFLARKVLEHVISHYEMVPLEQAQKWYDAHAEEFITPEYVEMRHIFIEASSLMTPDERKRAQERIQEAYGALTRGQAFEEVAGKYSESKSAEKGGFAGRLTRGIAPPPLESIAFNLGIGEISPVIETEHGYHIIKVEKHALPEKKPLESVTEEVAVLMRQEEEEQLIQKIIQEDNGSNIIFYTDNLTTSSPDTRVLRIDGKDYTLADLKTRLDSQQAIFRQDTMKKKMMMAFREELLAHRARQEGMHTSPEIQQSLRWVENYLLAQEYLEKTVFNTIAISEQEIRDFFTSHPEFFIQYERTRCLILTYRIQNLPENPADRHYVVTAAVKTLEQFRNNLFSLNDVTTSTTFAQEAREFTNQYQEAVFEDTGLIIPAHRGRVFDMTVHDLKPEEVSPVVKLNDGGMIVYCIQKESQRSLLYEEAAEKAELLCKRYKAIAAVKKIYDSIISEQGLSDTPTK